MTHRGLYTFLLIGLTLLFTASLGNGIWDRPLDYTDWNYRIFQNVCHQMPDRSFQAGGVPMAVNARCFGIFTGLLGGWLMLPVAVLYRRLQFRPGVILTVAVLLQIIDYTAGQFSIWNSSNFSRFLMGLLLGAAVVYMLIDQFRKPK